jgi:CheY-like chemotaxis protein
MGGFKSFSGVESVKAKILVADDSDLVARVAGQLATRFGYRVTACVSCGADALASLETDIPDLALVDLHMGGATTGIELAAELIRTGTRVVLLSALPTPRSHQLADQVGAHGLLAKPFGTVEFRHEVESALGRPRLHERVVIRTASSG